MILRNLTRFTDSLIHYKAILRSLNQLQRNFSCSEKNGKEFKVWNNLERKMNSREYQATLRLWSSFKRTWTRFKGICSNVKKLEEHSKSFEKTQIIEVILKIIWAVLKKLQTPRENFYQCCNNWKSWKQLHDVYISFQQFLPILRSLNQLQRSTS